MSDVTSGPSTRRDHRFFLVAGVAALAVVFAGFARTYYLKFAFGTPALPLLLHVHGIVMTLWFVLFITQACLIATHRVDLHRRLGVLGAVLAGLVVIVVTTVIVEAQKRNLRLGHPVLAAMAFQLSIVLVFAVLVTAAILLRRRSDFHKRLMLLACLSILSPGIVRIPLHFIRHGGVFALFGLLDLCLIVCVAVDTLYHRRVHPAFLWGGLLIVASGPLSVALGTTAAWMHFARWLLT